MPDNFPIQQWAKLYITINLKIARQKQPIFLFKGEVIWKASDSSLSKDLYAETRLYVLMPATEEKV